MAVIPLTPKRVQKLWDRINDLKLDTERHRDSPPTEELQLLFDNTIRHLEDAEDEMEKVVKILTELFTEKPAS